MCISVAAIMCCYFAFGSDSGVIYNNLAISIDSGVVNTIKGDIASSVDNEDDAIRAIKSINDVYDIGQTNTLSYSHKVHSSMGTVYRFDQYYKGISVYDRQVIVLADSNGDCSYIGGNYIQDIDLDVIPTISEDQATDCLMDGISYGEKSVNNNGLVIYSIDCEPILCYSYIVNSGSSSRIYFIDANDGDFVDDFEVSYVTEESQGGGFNIDGDMKNVSTIDYFDNNITIPLLYDSDPDNNPATDDDRYYFADDYRNIIMYSTLYYEANDQVYPANATRGSLSKIFYVNATGSGDSVNPDLSRIYYRTGLSMQDALQVMTQTDDIKTLITAYYNVVTAYDYYFNSDDAWYIQDTLDENDWQINQTQVFFCVDDTNKYENAFCSTSYLNGSYLTTVLIGDGNNGASSTTQTGFNHFGIDLDVLAHEYQHTMTCFTVSGGLSDQSLVYQGESGAINEAFSDIFGSLIEAEEYGENMSQDEYWLIGDTAVSGYYVQDQWYGAKGLRNMKRPGYVIEGDPTHFINIPSTYSTRYTGEDDEGGVHTNSSIINMLAYRLYLEGVYDNTTDMAELWYNTLTLLPKTCTMYQLADYLMTVGQNLGYEASTLDNMLTALETVELAGAGTLVPSTTTYYDVVFMYDDGLGNSARYTVKSGEALNVPNYPTREGYTCIGWALTPEGNVIADMVTELTNITENKVYHAKWSNEFSIYFYTSNDTATPYGDPRTVAYGGSTTLPEDPTREGYRFLGWSKTWGGAVISDMTSELSNITIGARYFAKWEILKYIVTFKSDNNTVKVNGFNSQQVEYGHSAIAPSNPTKTGYDFVEWDKDYSVITKDTVVNAVYSIKKFTVTFYKASIQSTTADGINLEYTVEKVQNNVEYGSSATAPEVTEWLGDFRMSGWDVAFDNVTSNITTKPVYEYGLADLVFKVEGEVVKSTTTNLNEVVAEEDFPVLEQKPGYVASWDYDGSAVTEDIVISAVYTKQKYTITVSYDGTVQEIEVEYGESVDTLEGVNVGFFEKLEFSKNLENITGDTTVEARVVIDYSKIIWIAFGGLIAIVIVTAIVVIVKSKKSNI